MSSIKLDDFKNSYDDFLRPNRFLFSIEDETWTTGLTWIPEYEYMCKGCSIPARNIGETTINWQGLSYKIPTDNNFDTFTATFLNDTDYKLRNYFENWLERISSIELNQQNIHKTIKASLVVSQLDGLGDITRIYRMVYAHPTSVGDIELDYDSNDQIQTFQVTFSYSYFNVEFQNI